MGKLAAVVLFISMILLIFTISAEAQLESLSPDASDLPEATSSYTNEELIAEIAKIELIKEEKIKRAEEAAAQKLIYADEGRAYLEREVASLKIWRKTTSWTFGIIVAAAAAIAAYALKTRKRRNRIFREPALLVQVLNPVFLSLMLKEKKQCVCGEEMPVIHLPSHLPSCKSDGARDLIKEFLGNMKTIVLFAPPKLPKLKWR